LATRAKARQFVDLKSNTVAGDVKKPLHVSVLNSRLKTTPLKFVQNRLVNCVAPGAGSNLSERH